MQNKLSEISASFTDRSVEEWKGELIDFLQYYFDNMSIHAMSDHTNYLQGRKEMLGEVVEFIKNN